MGTETKIISIRHPVLDTGSSSSLMEMDPRDKPEDDEACHSRAGGNPALKTNFIYFHKRANMPKSTSLKIQTIFGSPLKIPLLAIMMSISAFSTPLSLKNTPYFDPNASLNVTLFYAPWCPPCKRTLMLMEEIKKRHPKLHITTINVDHPHPLQEAKTFGLTDTVPYILIADHSGMVVKRFQTIPDKGTLEALIQRFEEGRLENGTLPAEQRIDMWKMNRKGM